MFIRVACSSRKTPLANNSFAGAAAPEMPRLIATGAPKAKPVGGVVAVVVTAARSAQDGHTSSAVNPAEPVNLGSLDGQVGWAPAWLLPALPAGMHLMNR